MKERITILKQKMAEKDIDILVATTPENVTNMTGFRSVSHQMLKGTLIFSVISREKDAQPILILPIGETDRVMDKTDIVELCTFGSNFNFVVNESLGQEDKQFLTQYKKNHPSENAFSLLAKTINERFGKNLHIGVDERGISPSEFVSIQNELGTSRVFEAFGFFKQARSIKTWAEIDLIQKALRITEEALRTTLNSIKEGISEIELQKIFEKYLIDQGALPQFTLVGFGSHGAYPNVKPSGRKLKKGELVRFDLGCTYESYFSDIARTAVLGRPNQKQQSYYDALLEGEQQILDNMREGAVVSELFEIGVSTVKKTIKAYRRHHVGHGIGIEVYDFPVLVPGDDTVLKENMVFCVETPYYELGYGGWQIEDEVRVTRNGFEFLGAPLERELWVIE
ncbi:MAG: aminopeptidase P family protein [Theionarchaea archaeon]|nr:aminopeptidase P family protein [Theionarchaea archaeon]